MVFSSCRPSGPTLRVLVVLLGCVFAAASSRSQDMSMTKSALRCELRGNENGNIYFGEYMHNMHFLLFSGQDGLKVYQEWNSWGYYARSFSAVDQDGPSKKYEIQRRPGEWTKNTPSTHTLNRGEFLITDIDLCDGTWSITPALPNAPAKLVITPHFEIGAREDAVTNGVWTGRIDGPPKEVFIEKTSVALLNLR
jgi:hypothetical protein